MTKPVKPELGPVQNTLLIPLLARARETERRRGLLRDPRAVELVRRLDYDLAKWEGGRSLKGAFAFAAALMHIWIRASMPRRRRRSAGSVIRPRREIASLSFM